jgi:acyl-CoA thioesterase FadM
MDVATIKDWLLPVSSSFALISTGVGIWIAVRDLGLKFKAEARLSQSAQVEADVQPARGTRAPLSRMPAFTP